MFLHHSKVDDDDLSTMAAEVDPTAPGGGRHLNFDTILRRCGHAWMAMLADAGCFGDGVIVPRLEVDYFHEVGPGPLEVEVRVATIGRSSFRLRLDVTQHAEMAARAEVVLVTFDYASRRPLPITTEQRDALGRHAA